MSRVCSNEGGVVKFLVNRGFSIPSPAALNKAHERLVGQLEAIVASSGVPVLRFKPGDCKEDIARPFQDEAAAAGRRGLVRFATEVITANIAPQLQVHYKSSKAKAYWILYSLKGKSLVM
jgi:hypothetical protein